MSDRNPTKDALKSLKRQLRDRTGEHRLFKLIEVKKEEPKEEEEEPKE
jgi:hypothetical protein